MIDLHVHSTCSDGRFSVAQIIAEAKARHISYLSITDHDTVKGQLEAIELCRKIGIRYLTGIELSGSFSHPDYHSGKVFQQHFLAYGFDPKNEQLLVKLEERRKARQARGYKIFTKVNAALQQDKLVEFTAQEITDVIEKTMGVLGRPHIALELMKKGYARDVKQAFEKYLIKCNVAYDVTFVDEFAAIIHAAGGTILIAHPNDPNGTSLAKITDKIEEQFEIIEKFFLLHIDGLEIWHSRHDERTINKYVKFCMKHRLLMSGGSDCHQTPRIILGTMKIPQMIVKQFDFLI